MEKFGTVKKTLFISVNGCLGVYSSVSCEKKNQAGNIVSNSYMSQSGNIYSNNLDFVIFEYRDPNLINTGTQGPSLYVTYAQFEDIKDILADMKNNIPSAFVEVNGELVVKPDYAQPKVLSGIGNDNKFISFGFAVISDTVNGVTTRIPSIEIKLSTADGFSSLLTIKEFKTLKAVLEATFMTLPLESVLLGVDYVMSKSTNTNFNNNNYYNNRNNNYNNNRNYNNGYNNNYQSQPRYNNQGYQQNRQYQQQPQQNLQHDDGTTPMMPRTNNTYKSATNNVNTNNNYQQPQQTQQNLQPRSQSIINMAAVSEVPVEDFNLNDSSAIDDLFN